MHDLVNTSSAFLSLGIEGYGIPVLEAIRLGTPVLFDGIQPAGDLMAGSGAQRVAAGSTDQLAQMFIDYSAPGPQRLLDRCSARILMRAGDGPSGPWHDT